MSKVRLTGKYKVEWHMTDNIKHIDDSNFDATISNGTVLVDFSAEWCGPCKMLNPILDNLANEVVGKVVVAKIDVDQSPKATQKFEITSVPTLILFKKGQENSRIVGLKDLETLKKIVLQ
jgi:thioredoxin 1